jgi:3-hydroxybutyryl-CoA dehydrogenase
VKRIGVVGCGLMGAGIAEVAARSGLNVLVVETSRAALDQGRERITSSLRKSVDAGKLETDECDATLERLTFSTELTSLVDVSFVVEAVSEQATIKFDLFRQLDQLFGDRAVVLASNTSSIPISRIAEVTTRPERVIGLHFFNPVPSMKLVEVIAGARTSDDTIREAHELAAALNKTTVSAPDQAGFIVNALLIPYLLAAIRLFETGSASAQDIDTAMVLGCGHPMGPLRLTDLIGLDTTLAIAEVLFSASGEAHLSPPPLLVTMVAEGRRGRKSGEGFFSYPQS